MGKYELLLPLGTGGTATVYLARTRGVAGFEREVALKLVHAHLRGDEESRLHLLEEARLAARIRHPNVVSVTEVDADTVGVFLVMDYVEGEALSGLVHLLRDHNHRLPTRLIARIMNDALAGLHAAHELRDSQGQPVGLVHRDFSPQNILIGVEGVTRLADFGVAKAASRTVRTKTGLVKGKVAYMSPEQARGHKVDRRCDVWAAGVVVWELVTGRKLYDHEDDVATLLSVVTEEPQRLGRVLQGVPASLDDAVAYALTSDVNRRCPSAEAFRCMLESAWDECGGMGTTAELGAFVRQTVGHKLAERRALALRGRTSTPPAPAVDSAGLAPDADGSAAQASEGGGREQREDGTKTAISAAVPAAERIGSAPPARAWRRSIGLTVMGGVSVLAAVTGIVASHSGETPHGTAITPPAAPAAPAAVRTSAIPASEDSALRQAGSPPGSPSSTTRETAPASAEEAPGTEDERSEKADSAAAGSAASAHAHRPGTSRPKSLPHRIKPRASAHTGTPHADRSSASTEPRVLPLPSPSERQQRSRLQNGAPESTPLPLASDPYEPSR
ncbi:MAG TPA: protein kinase [Polyangiaceae bacterium]|nr:protein kinase [Polyangiaceae bacterium]